MSVHAEMQTAKITALLPTTSNVSFDDALLIAERCFGELGRQTVFLWRQYNEAYFGGVLRVTPVLYVPTSPYGHWVGRHEHETNIYLMFPNGKRSWGFVRGVLLHEMVHQHLDQQGKDSRHAGTPWCEEIMRLSKFFGKKIWAGKYTVLKGRRANLPPPPGFTGARILNQKQIAQMAVLHRNRAARAYYLQLK